MAFQQTVTFLQQKRKQQNQPTLYPLTKAKKQHIHFSTIEALLPLSIKTSPETQSIHACDTKGTLFAFNKTAGITISKLKSYNECP